MGVLLAIGVLSVLSASPASAEQNATDILTLQRNLDYIWILLSAALVLLMQVGFMLLEAGMVRSKNSINVAQKNLLDFGSSVIAFALFGFMFAFGASNGFFIGADTGLLLLREADAWVLVFFIFQVMFCGTAATIVSGAVAERMHLSAYILCSIFTAGLVYPVVVHLAWGNALTENASALFAHAGFVDFAGSTVVHGTGAWIALAACIIIGARAGRFNKAGNPIRFQGHSPVLAATGAILLFVGWIGFNGGSTLSVSNDIAHIIANTILAGAMGTASGYAVGWWRERVLLPDKAFSGMLGGLVAVTAGCMILDAQGAMIVGLVGGAIAVWSISFIETRLRIDDAVGAIGIHGVAGVTGTIGLAFLAPVELLPTGSRFEQFIVQTTGVLVHFVWTFGLAFAFFAGLSRVMRLRVEGAAEEVGLNEAEHGTRLGIGHVEDAVSQLVSGNADLTMRLPVTPGDDAERITGLFNALMENLEGEERQRGRVKERLRDRQEAERLQTLADATFDAIIMCADGRVIDGNAALEHLLDTPLAKLKGRRLKNLVAAADRAVLEAFYNNTLPDPFELSVLRSDETTVPVEIRTRDIVYRGHETTVFAMVDLRARKEAESKIRFLAQHDPLSGLPNRAVFSENLASFLSDADRRADGLAVLLIDLDRFKDINDLHGHPTGDRVITVVADRLRHVLRSDDIVARLGGDEFAVLQRGVQFVAQAEDLARRLVVELAKPIDGGEGLTLRSGGSVGIAVAPIHSNDPEALMSRADTALYRAKQLGRGTYCIYEDGMDAEERKRKRLEKDLSQAIEREEFSVHLQPRLCLKTGKVSGYEALLRWSHPSKGAIPPADFIPVAEQSGRIIEIGAWVLRSACAIAADHPSLAHISVNVSPVQFRDRGFVSLVEDTLSDYDLRAERLELEVTESVLIDDDQRAQDILKSLKQLGVGLALDDFGTGYSSLGYLGRFPFDVIKIDRSFVQSINETANGLAIVDSVARLGRALGMKIVAEGVETQAQFNLLAGLGCDEVQGFLIARPETVTKALLSSKIEQSAHRILKEYKAVAADEELDLLRA